MYSVYRIEHYYDKPDTAPAFVAGPCDPTGILVFLQCYAGRNVDEGATLLNSGAAHLLTKYYGFHLAQPQGWSKTIDLYVECEFDENSGPGLRRRLARAYAAVRYFRFGLRKEIRSCVEF